MVSATLSCLEILHWVISMVDGNHEINPFLPKLALVNRKPLGLMVSTFSYSHRK